MADVVHLPKRRWHSRPLSKKELAAALGFSRRWVELRMREGMPVEPRASTSEPARFDLAKVQAWRGEQEQTRSKPLTLEQRVAMLERRLADLDRKAS